jgi:hypothetical protein
MLRWLWLFAVLSVAPDDSPQTMYEATYASQDWLAHIKPEMKGPGNMAWGDSYTLMSYVAMYEGTGDTVHLDRLVKHFDLALSVRDAKTGKRDEYRNKVMPSWGTGGYSQGKWTAWLVHTGMLTYPAASFVRHVSENAKLQPKYKAKADEYLAVLEEIVAAYDDEWKDGPAEGEGYYESKPIVGKPLPLNQQNALGRTLVQLAAVTKKPQYRDKATKLARYFKNRLRLMDNGAYAWEYWGAKEGKGEDISHAAINADFAALCYRNNIVFTRDDMTKLAATFTKNIIKPDGTFAATVAGSGTVGELRGQLGRWLNLCEFDRRIYDAVLKDLRENPSHRTLKGLGNLVKWEKKVAQ